MAVRVTLVAFLTTAAVLTPGVGLVRLESQSVPLSALDVQAVIRAAAEAIGDNQMAAAVVDRGGRILAVYARPGASADTPDTAVTVARTAAMFSNNQAPLSTRTVRFISGIHFPPGVPNTPNAALYGIENTNRGCQLDAADSAPIERPRSIAGSGLAGPALPCNTADRRGCARGGPIGASGLLASSIGFTTGKEDVRDGGEPGDVPVSPGGFALYRDGQVVGGVGVAGVAPERAEYAAFVSAATTALTTRLGPLPFNPLPPPGAVFVDGLRLPFFADCISVDCVLDEIQRGPPGGASGTYTDAHLRVAPRAALPVGEGYLVTPRASAVPGGLTAAEVQRIIQQAVDKAAVTRAQIRLPLGQTTRMIIAVSDQAGALLGAFRMPDSTIFSFDVAVTKARNAYYFSSREGYDVLRGIADRSGYSWDPAPPPGQGWAITNRTLGFGGQPLFPPGIDLTRAPTPGPWFDLFTYDLLNPCTEGPGPSRGANPSYLHQSGIVWFPGSAPLYRGGVLVGGIGVSGDGVEQDDYVTAAAVAGFEAPAALRADRSTMQRSGGAPVRLPYWKFPRNPEQR